MELPEYSGHFIDYKALKKLIKQLGMSTEGYDYESPATPVQIQQTLKENKASFFFRVERELDKVNSFYLEKQANLAINLDLLVMKKNDLLTKSYQLAQGLTDPSTLNFKNSILYLNLYQNFKKIHQDLLRLQQFIELNEVGFLKVMKKWDKRSKSHTKESFLQTAVKVQPVFHKSEINELSDVVTQSLFDLESIVDGDYSVLDNYKDVSIRPTPPTSRNGSIAKLEDESFTTPKEKEFGNQQLNASVGHSISSFQNRDTDELYSSFVNVATINVPDLSVLARWVEKVRSTSVNSEEPQASAKFTLSKIFLLSLGNLKISDSFLESFLKLIDYDIDFEFISHDFNNNKSMIHECCSIPPASTLENSQHVIINNGVKVVNSTDSISHSRISIVKHIVETLSPTAIEKLLICKDFNGRTCLHHACQNNRLDLLEILVPRFPKSHIDDLDNESMSALLLAIKYDNFKAIMKLIENGSNCFPEFSDSAPQYLPINYACKFGSYETLEFLLSSSSPTSDKVNKQDVEGLLPLHVVARAGNFKLIKLLYHYGALVNQLDGLNKWPPIFYAALEGHDKTTKELIKFGAKLDIVDEDGYNVLYYCVVEGHIKVLNQLLSYMNYGGQNPGDISMDASSPEERNIQSITQGAAMSILDEGEDSEDSGHTDKNVDSIPHLELPPPILPLRRYGHNFLEQKVLIELIFPNDSKCINLFNSATDLKPGRITITSNISDLVPRNILLPVSDGNKGSANCIFQTEVESLNEFRIDFEIFPKFGTRLISKTTALNFSQVETSSPEINSIVLPLFDSRLRNIGELKFNYQVIFPFSGTLLETAKYDTYWKSSTSFVKGRPVVKFNAAGGLSPNNFLSPTNINANLTNAINQKNGNSQNASDSSKLTPANSASSFVTATSLSGEYLKIKICMLNDGTPVVCPHWAIAVADNIELFLPNLSLDQLSQITSNLFDYDKVLADLAKMTANSISFVKKLLKIIYLPLETVLKFLDDHINLAIEFVFPSLYELDNIPFAGNIQLSLNTFIDLTLNLLFNHIRSLKINQTHGGRSFIFLSSNSIICKILNWKQPNFPVFLIMNGIVFNNKKGAFESRTANGILMDELENEPSAKTQIINPTVNQTTNSKIKHQLLANDQELTIRSIKEAVNFAIDNNLIGIVSSINLLNLVPKLVPLIRSRGLILIASKDSFDPQVEDSFSSKELLAYNTSEINGLRFDDMLSFKDDISKN